jgi:hypothetical protein
MFVEKVVKLLVEQFGLANVRSALAAVSGDIASPSPIQPRLIPSKSVHHPTQNIPFKLDQLQQNDREKHALLAAFYASLKNREVLKESQDIRQFAQLIGIKELKGNSRRDLIPPLMRFLFERPAAQLKVDIDRAASVSEAQRQQGFSVLTDKLLGER